MKKEIVREELSKLDFDTRYEFEAVFVKTGVDKRFPEKKKNLLVDIYLIKPSYKKYISDHVWVSQSKRWKNIMKNIKEGDKISFTAEVKKYYKEGNKEFFENYALTSIRSVKIINN